jgi:class 3 adenylate cyclase/tetratricopeptide (TPR) repeat protein
LACASCGTVLPAGSRFCNKCGTPVTAERDAPARRTSPEAYTPKHLAEKILTSKAALEGERKQVTVLFADLKGSMELLADRDPEDARKLLDPVVEHMMEAVHRYEGTVNQVMGDGIMALFGAPLAHEDHAVRACYAALRMQESVKRYAMGVRKVEGIPIQIRVGLNSGEVLVRSIGSDLHMDYTAVGQTTHLAARMEQMATPESILMTAHTLSLVEGYVQVNGLGALPVKGLSGPMEVYEVVGAETARSRLHAARALTGFVGRDPEMDQLYLAHARAMDGHGQVVAVVGEPGVGKSRLYWEFTRSHRIAGALVLESRSVSYGTAMLYLPVIDLLKAYFQIDATDVPRRMREKVTGKLLSLDEALRPILPPVLSLLDLPVEEAAWQTLDPLLRRQRTLEAVKLLLLRESQVQPVLVVFEDLHWIDSETQALLDSLVDSLPTARLLLLVNYRPEYRHTWGSKTYYRQLHIDPLPPESADVLLHGLLGSDATLHPLRALLIPRTGGNPFFLEESVRTLVETGVLMGERGAYKLARAAPSIQIPETVQAVLAARIDRLPPEEKRLLQCAAAVGKDVPFSVLTAIADGPESELRRCLVNLQAAEFLYEARLFPDLEYVFKHALTQEVAFAGLTSDRRRALDTAIVGVLEQLTVERPDEQVERLAHHAFRGESWSKAATYLQQAGDKASTRSAYRQAIAHFERALLALAHQPEGRDTLEQFVDIKLSARSALLALSELESALVHMRDALSAAERLQDSARIALSFSGVGHVLCILGRALEALPYGRSAVEAATILNERGSSIRAHMVLGATHWLLGHYRQATDHLEGNRELTKSDIRRGAALPFSVMLDCATSRAWLAFNLIELGEFDAAIRVAEEAMELVESAQHYHPLSRFAVPFVHLRRGEGVSVIPDLEQGVARCTAMNNLNMATVFSAALGQAYTLAGRSADAVALLEDTVIRSETYNRANRALWLNFLSEAYLRAGRPSDAAGVARRGLVGAHSRQERGEEAWNLRALAEALCADASDVSGAEGHYREALALAGELGMRPLVARCHAGLANLYRRTGQDRQARELLTTAMTMYREMGMRFWLNEAEAEMNALE